LAIQAFSGGIQQFPIPDFVLTESIADGDILVYRDVDKAFHNETGNFTTLAQVNALIASITSGGSVDLSDYVTTTALATQVATLNTSIGTKADKTYVDAQIAGIDSPDLSNYVTTSALSGTIANYDLSSEVTSKINTAIASATFFDGDYNNLTNTPAIPSLTGYATQTWVQTQIANTTIGTLSDVSSTAPSTGQVLKWNGTTWAPAADSTSGGGGSDADTLDSQDGTYYLDYNNFTNTPTIPTDTDTTYTAGTGLTLTGTEFSLTYSHFDGQFSSLTGTPTTLAGYGITDGGSGVWADITGKPTTIAGFGITDAFDGDYTNLTNKPTIPADISDLTDTTNLLSGAAYTDASVDTHLNRSSATTGQVLSWSGTDYAWVAQTGGSGGATTLGGLSDVSSTSPTNGQVLKWNSTNSEWEPALDATTGVGGSSYATEAYVDQKLLERGDHFSGDYNDLNNLPTLFSGSFPDLNNKPTTIAGYGITDSPTSLLDLSISDGTVGQVLVTDGAGNFSFTNGTGFNGDYNALTNLPSLFSGNYNDLANQPYIPSIAGLASTSYVDSKVVEPNVIREVRVSNVVLATHDNYVMSIETTDATPTEALLTTGNRIVIDDDSTVMYKVHIIGADGTDNYGIKLQGIIDRTSGTLALIGTPSKETLADTTNDTWSGSVSADTTNNSLKILVTGEAAKTVNWTIFVEQNVVKR
jgi:hypothetical protein